MTASRRRPITDAAAAGWTALRIAVTAPGLIVGLYVVTLAVALFFAVLMGAELREALDRSHPAGEVPYEIDADWWLEYRRHASGLAATFTPHVIGAAAPLDNLSAVLDATPKPWALIFPLGLYLMASAWWWGGALRRMASGRPLGLVAFAGTGWHLLPRLLAVNLAALSMLAILYATVHPLMFGPIYEWLSGQSATAHQVWAWRFVLYGVFGALLVTVGVIADYVRIFVATPPAATWTGAWRMATSFLAARKTAAALLAIGGLMAGALLLSGYAAVDLFGGARVGGWRGVLWAQAYIIGRVALRVLVAAAHVQLTVLSPLQASSAPLSPGPPAAV